MAAGPDRSRAGSCAADEAGRCASTRSAGRHEAYIADERRLRRRPQRDAGATMLENTVVGIAASRCCWRLIPLVLLYLSCASSRRSGRSEIAARRLASGEEPRPRPGGGRRRGGRLARSFNAMADALEVTRTELEQRGVRLGETNRAAARGLRGARALQAAGDPRALDAGAAAPARVLVLPIIGALDLERAQQLDDRLLSADREPRARVVVIDVTGVPGARLRRRPARAAHGRRRCGCSARA